MWARSSLRRPHLPMLSAVLGPWPWGSWRRSRWSLPSRPRIILSGMVLVLGKQNFPSMSWPAGARSPPDETEHDGCGAYVLHEVAREQAAVSR